MTELKFIKDHPSRRFKKGDIVEMPNENVDAWLKSGYVVVPKDDTGDAVGNVQSSSKDGGESETKSTEQSKFGKSKKKKRGKK